MSKKIILFDVDGTLTEPRKRVKDNMLEFLAELRKKHTIGIVGGSDLQKQAEQLGENVVSMFDYVFSENGLVAFKAGEEIHRNSIAGHYGDQKINEFINYTLRKLSEIEIPVKRGTFIEFRTGMLNISPVGRNCSQKERDEFEQYDKEHKIRERLLEDLKAKFGESMKLKFSIGGQISMDVFPQGWDKTYCLRHIAAENFDEIHFFGDKTFEGGNDYEIFVDDRTVGHTTTGPEHTIEQCKKLFF